MSALIQDRRMTFHRCPKAVEPLVAVLRQLEDLLEATTDDQYTTKPVGVVKSSIGGHIRHNLDHIEALLAGIATGSLDYDHRERGTDAETCRSAAIAAIDQLVRELSELPGGIEGRWLQLSALLTSTGVPVTVETTVGRELAFVLSHTIHHNALIGVMAALLGIPVPERFGYAPSTIAHLEKRTCAR